MKILITRTHHSQTHTKIRLIKAVPWVRTTHQVERPDDERPGQETGQQEARTRDQAMKDQDKKPDNVRLEQETK